MAFDSVQVRFQDVHHNESPFANTRTVPFVDSYFEILKSVIADIETEYFWFFANFINLKTADFLDYIPEQHEKNQIHVWYATHPKTGLNKEGNVMLIPTKKFKEQMHELNFLRDYKDINYHEDPVLFQQPISRTTFTLKNPIDAYHNNTTFYKWMINKDMLEGKIPNFYPSFWEDEKMYTWGDTKDIMLLPGNRKIKQFYDIERCVHFELSYTSKAMDIVFLSYDEPSAEKYWKVLKEKYPRAKRVQGVKGRTEAYHAAAEMSDTEYFFAVFPKLEIVDSFKFDFQPDRLKNPCHYIFNCKNTVNDLEYGHGAVLLYNKQLALLTLFPGLDFTLSKPHDHVPILSAINHFNETPWLAWRTAFREVIKLSQMKPTVESQHRLKIWCQLGKGENAEWVHKGANDAKNYYTQQKHNHEELMKSYDFEWLKDYYESKY